MSALPTITPALHRHQEAWSNAGLEQLRIAVDEHAIISIADVKGNIIHVNDRFCAISGYRREELLGQNHRMVKSATHPPEFYRELWRTIGAGQTWHGEVCNRRSNGELYWVDATIVPVLDEAGKPTSYISIRTDITSLKHGEEALRRSEERFSFAVEGAGDGISDWNMVTGERPLSGHYEAMLGYGKGEVEPTVKAWEDSIHPDDRDRMQQHLQDYLSGNSPDYDVQLRLRCNDGRYKWILCRGTVVARDDTGNPTRMIGIHSNISERKKAEESVKLASQYSRSLIEASLDPLVTINIDGKITDVNTATEQVTGVVRADLVGSDFAVYFTDPTQAREGYQQVFAKGFVTDYPLAIRHTSGKIIDVLYNASVYRDDAGKVLGVFAAARDVTERKKAEESVKLASQYSRSLIEASLDPLVTINIDGKITDVNTATEQVTGVVRADLVGSDFAVYFTDPTQAREGYQQVFAKGFVTDYPLAIRHTSGKIIDVLYNASVYRDDAGKVLGVFAAARDVTERKKAEAALVDARESAERANYAKSAFLSSMSHELRTPMNAILGFSQMLEYDSSLNADQQDNVHEILKGGRHLLELINEVLDLAKIEAGRIDLSMEPVELTCLVEDCRQLILPLAAARQITLRLLVPPNTAVQADRTRLKQVLLNLLSNAIKYNREGGEIRLGLQAAANRWLRITVADNGGGIAPEDMDQLFQPFTRINAKHSDIEGTGIGLTITRSLVELMGGKVGVDSQVGLGSTFWIELPSATPARPQEGSISMVAAPDALKQSCRVLCIDDNPVNLKLIAQMLRMRPAIYLITAHTPELGIELALAHRPELILLDINMPGMNGYQVLEVLKADARLAAIPVIAVTANAMPRDIKRGRAAGFIDYLTKPLDVGHFLLTIDHCLLSKDGHTV
jgi:PAS domain S-box-containing protein